MYKTTTWHTAAVTGPGHNTVSNETAGVLKTLAVGRHLGCVLTDDIVLTTLANNSGSAHTCIVTIWALGMWVCRWLDNACVQLWICLACRNIQMTQKITKIETKKERQGGGVASRYSKTLNPCTSTNGAPARPTKAT
eukprot:1141857-Pelagomonas_calceolata.AAC.2